MEKRLSKSLRNTFLSTKYVLATIFFISVVYLLNATANNHNTKTGGRITLLSTTIPKTDATERTNLVEHTKKAEQHNEWQTVHMRVTAYCPCRKCCGKFSDGITACGHKIHTADTFVSADKKYPFDTEMIIDGYNNGEPVKVLDRGGAIYGNRLDVFFNSHKQARKWGVRYIDVKVRR